MDNLKSFLIFRGDMNKLSVLSELQSDSSESLSMSYPNCLRLHIGSSTEEPQSACNLPTSSNESGRKLIRCIFAPLQGASLGTGGEGTDPRSCRRSRRASSSLEDAAMRLETARPEIRRKLDDLLM